LTATPDDEGSLPKTVLLRRFAKTTPPTFPEKLISATPQPMRRVNAGVVSEAIG